MVANLYFLTDFSDLTYRLFMSSTKVAFTMKVLNHFFNNKSIQKIRKMHKEFEILSPHEDESIQKLITIFGIILFLYYLLSNMTITLWNISTLYADEKVLAFSGWYPGFDWEHNQRDYWIIFIYQYIGITITGNLNVSIDSFFCFSMYLISAEFEILGNRLKEIQTKPQIGSIKLEFVKHVKIYNDIIEIIHEMKNNLALTYFTQLILSGIVVCSCTTGLAKVNLTIL